MLNKQGMRVNVKKALAIIAVTYIFLMAAAGIVWAAVGVLHATPSLARYSWYILIALAGLVSLLCLAFYLPMSNAFMKYAVEDITLKSGFWPSVKMSFRHWGLLFITYFLMGLIISVICIIVMMPYLILTLAQAQSSSGVAMGDPSGLPASFSWLVAVTYALTFFVMAVVAVWPMLTAYFLYGSIEQLEIERKKSEDQTMA